jgi:hypothetical protein
MGPIDEVTEVTRVFPFSLKRGMKLGKEEGQLSVTWVTPAGLRRWAR